MLPFFLTRTNKTMEVFIVSPSQTLGPDTDAHKDKGKNWSGVSLVEAKSRYLALLSKTQQACHTHKQALPHWCHDSSAEMACASLAKGRRNSCDDSGANQLGLRLQSLHLTDDLIRDLPDLSPESLEIPKDLGAKDSPWIHLKKLQLETDVALVQYKLAKAVIKRNKLVKENLSKEALSPAEETRALHIVLRDCDKCRLLRQLDVALRRLLKDLPPHHDE